jgi:hypothetical protein
VHSNGKTTNKLAQLSYRRQKAGSHIGQEKRKRRGRTLFPICTSVISTTNEAK